MVFQAALGALGILSDLFDNKQQPITQGSLAQGSDASFQPSATQVQVPQNIGLAKEPQAQQQQIVPAAAPQEKESEAPPSKELDKSKRLSELLANTAAAAQIGSTLAGQLFEQPDLSLQGALAQPSNFQFQPTAGQFDPRRRVRGF